MESVESVSCYGRQNKWFNCQGNTWSCVYLVRRRNVVYREAENHIFSSLAVKDRILKSH